MRRSKVVKLSFIPRALDVPSQMFSFYIIICLQNPFCLYQADEMKYYKNFTSQYVIRVFSIQFRHIELERLLSLFYGKRNNVLSNGIV